MALKKTLSLTPKRIANGSILPLLRLCHQQARRRLHHRHRLRLPHQQMKRHHIHPCNCRHPPLLLCRDLRRQQWKMMMMRHLRLCQQQQVLRHLHYRTCTRPQQVKLLHRERWKMMILMPLQQQATQSLPHRPWLQKSSQRTKLLRIHLCNYYYHHSLFICKQRIRRDQ